MKSLKGQFLLDGGKLAGSDFHHTVVLICEHDSEGALGLVLNRTSEQTIEESLTIALPEALQELPLFIGGPVHPNALSCLIQVSPATDSLSKSPILPGLRLTHNLDELFEPSGNFLPFKQIKFFAGYAGWSPGQLDAEMETGAWLTHPASLEFVFHPQPEELWKLILRGKGLQYRLLAEAPDDISSN